MRAPRYRGLDITTRQWRYGLLTATGIDTATITDPDGIAHTVIADSVGQSTALRDIDGAEVYEGDLLIDRHDKQAAHEKGTSRDSWGQRFSVRWHPLYACFYARSLAKQDNRAIALACATCRVIGNTTENPEPTANPRRYSDRGKPLNNR
ncbi:MAG: YopX family protein [Bacteroidales bacterium]|nr:YopX family protein [Bacteroidales bacterium]